MAAEDKIIVDFFREMKSKDKELPIMPTPALPKQKTWWPYAVAASFTLAIITYVISSQPETPTQPIPGGTVEITLTGVPASPTESLVTHAASIETWESPTQSLINDF